MKGKGAFPIFFCGATAAVGPRRRFHNSAHVRCWSNRREPLGSIGSDRPNPGCRLMRRIAANASKLAPTARMEHSDIGCRPGDCGEVSPDFTSFNPGYTDFIRSTVASRVIPPQSPSSSPCCQRKRTGRQSSIGRTSNSTVLGGGVPLSVFK